MTDDGNGGKAIAGSESKPATKDAGEVLEILKQRASALARKKTATNSEELLEIVRFVIDGQSYAFEVGQLREVCTLSQITKVPCTQDFIVGVINLRGQIIPIADIRTFMNIPGHGPPVFNKAIIVENEDVSIGFLADEVVRAEKVPLSTIQKVLTSMSGVTAECLRGITRDKTFLLDVPQILASPRLYASKSVDLD
jgi:purine-binding chemotaxis protein CheW